MKRKIFYINIVFLILFLNGKHNIAQNWLPLNLNNGVGSSLSYLYTDTINNLIYASGSFTANNDNIYGGVAKWNGITWDTLPNCQEWPTKFLVFKYLDTLYISGFFSNMIPFTNIAKWNGSTFDTLNGTRQMKICCTAEKDGILYLGGYFNVCGNDSAFSLCKYDGHHFSVITPNYNGNAYILSMAFYKDTLYVGGNFGLNSNLSIASLAKWDGTGLIAVSSEFANVGCTIETMAVYKDELYVGGAFTKSNGYTGDYIMKWDGNQFTEVGGGTNQRVKCMKVYNNELYVGGWFTEVGGNPCKNVAKWDGSQWICLNQEDFNNFTCIWDICILHDELYVAGSFSKIGNDSIKDIAKLNHPLTSIKKNAVSETSLNVYPNPSNGNYISVSFPFIEKGEYQVLNVLGEVILSDVIKNTDKVIINASSLAKGCYVIQVQYDDKSLTSKFIKL